MIYMKLLSNDFVTLRNNDNTRIIDEMEQILDLISQSRLRDFLQVV